MSAIEKIKEEAKTALEQKKVQVVLGYKQGLNGVTPHIFKDSEQIKDLIWNNKCVHNLSVYLKEIVRQGNKVCIIGKGCDIDSIMMLIKEFQIKREDVYIIGLECYETIDRNDKTFDKCRSCSVNKPKMNDVLIQADNVKKIDKADYWHDLEEFEKKSPEEREKFWKEQAAKCIRCYACRQACPLCFCEECFADQTVTRFIDPSPSIKGNLQWFHMRAFDLAGRCTGCRECDRVCPVDIPWVLLNKAAEKQIKENFKDDPEKDNLPLFTFKKDDKEDFII